MASTLLISGALAEKAVLKFLRSPEAAGCVVVEFDTMHDRQAFPHVGHWFSASDFITTETAARIDQETRELLCFYLEARPQTGERPGEAALRKACLKTRDQQIAVPFLANKHVADKLLDRFSFHRILVAPGCGVNFPCWRQVAAERGIPLNLWPVEKNPSSFRRRIQKLLRRARRVRQSAVRPMADEFSTPVASLPQVICASERVSRMIRQEKASGIFQMTHVSMDVLGRVSEEELKEEAQHFRQWWKNWQKTVYPETSSSPASPLAGEFREVLRTLGESYIDRIYPLHSILKKRALEHLREARPALLLCDTQTDNSERVWSLAAAELNIPVAAFTYDHFVDPELTFTPDYLLTDGVRNTLAATRKGYPQERIIEARGHRRPAFARRTPAELDSAFGEPRPKIIFADSYYASLSATADPQASLHCYRRIIAAARRLPQMQFFIKFHPLRVMKSELLSFAGMDEHELHVKKRFIATLKPPANLTLLAPEVNMIQSLMSASVLVNTFSTSGHEAFHLGVPVVFLRRPDPKAVGYPEIDQFMEVLHAPDEDAVVGWLTKLTTDAAMRQRQIMDQQHYIDDFYWRSNITLSQALETLLHGSILKK